MSKIRLLFAILLLHLFVAGCRNSQFDNNYLTLMDVTGHLMESGIRIEEVQELMPFFEADSAVSLQIAGSQIGIYKYNVVLPAQKRRIEDIASKGYVFVEGLKFPVLVNGTFMLLGYEKNPERDRIIQAFSSFQPE